MLFVLRDLMRTAHVVAGAVWVGGSMMYLLVIGPALRLSKASREVGMQIAVLFRRLVNICIGVLVLSGVYLVFDRLTAATVGIAYVIVLAVKIVAALAMILLAINQAQEARRLVRQRSRLWKISPQLILWLGIITFFLGATLTGLYEAGLTR